jgi:hypothetical protein
MAVHSELASVVLTDHNAQPRTLQSGEVVRDVNSRLGIPWADTDNNTVVPVEGVAIVVDGTGGASVLVQWEGTFGSNDHLTDTDALAALPDNSFAAVTIHWGMLTFSSPAQVLLHVYRWVGRATHVIDCCVAVCVRTYQWIGFRPWTGYCHLGVSSESLRCVRTLPFDTKPRLLLVHF